MEQEASAGTCRGSREAWLEAAYEALVESGVDGVKILPMAGKLKLSRTSFYWFFKDREELLSSLLLIWREKNTGNILKQAAAYAETIAEAMLNVFDCWLNEELFDSQLEFAIRSWALQSADILAAVHQADQMRLNALRAMLIRFGHNEDSADVHARTAYLVQIGYISSQTREDIGTRMKRMRQYVRIFSGCHPEQRELNRFYARHGYRP